MNVPPPSGLLDCRIRQIMPNRFLWCNTERGVMFRVSREIHFCYGHRLLRYAGKCRHLHGHNGKAVITLETSHLDALGMVVDFTDIKHVLGRWIDDNLDHKMLLHRDDPLIPELQRLGEPFVALDCNPTAENIARLIFEQAQAAGLPVVEVTLWETESSYATYRPSVGC
jgi:6-pyruvoyltetrahydropterin/6-carboxytetrahydropterin synthase